MVHVNKTGVVIFSSCENENKVWVTSPMRKDLKKIQNQNVIRKNNQMLLKSSDMFLNKIDQEIEDI